MPLGDFDFSKLMENPELLAIGLDKMGQSIGGPTTPFGGVGTFLGQSSLANKALQETRQEREDWQKLIAQAFGIGAPDESALKSPISMSDTTRSLTPGEKEGPTKTTTKLDADGNTIRTTEQVIAKPKIKGNMLDLGELTSSPF